jgi:hypothetical protein
MGFRSSTYISYFHFPSSPPDLHHARLNEMQLHAGLHTTVEQSQSDIICETCKVLESQNKAKNYQVCVGKRGKRN